MKCFIILEGGLHDGYAVKNVYLSEEKGIKELLFLVNNYNNEQENVNDRLNRKVNNSLRKDEKTNHEVLSYSNSVDFVSLIERVLINDT